MLAIVGTVPDPDFGLEEASVTLDDDHLFFRGKKVVINRGTPALVAAAAKACAVLDLPPPVVLLVGDIGRGDGSQRLYEYLTRHLGKRKYRVMTFHYLQPDVDWHNRVLFALEEMKVRPTLIADAGFMYAAKMSGQAPSFDLFTPDVGELAFLADEDAPHPFYTRGFILHEEYKVPDLIARAFQNDNAARHLLVKGQRDYVADLQGIQVTIDDCPEEAMEAIGGTGDTLTGIVSALVAADLEIIDAAALAARVNRLSGYYAHPTPATQVMDIIHQIPRALKELLGGRTETSDRQCAS